MSSKPELRLPIIMQICEQSPLYSSERVAAREPLKFLRLNAYGIPIGLATGLDLLPYLPSPLIPGAELGAEPGLEIDALEPPLTLFRFQHARSVDGSPAFQVVENGSDVWLSGDIQAAARVLESRIHQCVAASTEVAVFVHAGVVRWDGRAVVIPGASHSGKSTLVAALVSMGATYYSDEYAVIDLEGRVHGFPRRLRLRADVSQQNSAAIPKSGETGPLPPLPLGWVLNIQYNPAGNWRPTALTRGQMLLALLGNTVAVRRQSELTIQTLKAAVGSAQGWHSDRADAMSAAQDILQLLDRNGRATAPQNTKLAI
jgi:hypothetical protein